MAIYLCFVDSKFPLGKTFLLTNFWTLENHVYIDLGDVIQILLLFNAAWHSVLVLSSKRLHRCTYSLLWSLRTDI